jgi:hypothetical protein
MSSPVPVHDELVGALREPVRDRVARPHAQGRLRGGSFDAYRDGAYRKKIKRVVLRKRADRVIPRAIEEGHVSPREGLQLLGGVYSRPPREPEGKRRIRRDDLAEVCAKAGPAIKRRIEHERRELITMGRELARMGRLVEEARAPRFNGPRPRASSGPAPTRRRGSRRSAATRAGPDDPDDSPPPWRRGLAKLDLTPPATFAAFTAATRDLAPVERARRFFALPEELQAPAWTELAARERRARRARRKQVEELGEAA